MSGLDPRKFFSSLEALRGIAALTVVMFHVGWSNPVTTLNIFRNGYLMVDLFFVLSGFVICHSYRTRVNSVSDVGRFLWLRLGRLYPVHFAFLMVWVAIEVLRYFAANTLGLDPVHAPFSVNNVDGFVRNLLLVQGLTVDRKLTFNGPSWSISVEVFAYVFFALAALSPLFKRGRLATFCALALLSAAGLVFADTPSLFFDDCKLSLLRCTSEFFLGAATYEVWYQRPLTFPSAIDKFADSAVLAVFVLFLGEKSRGASDFLVPILSAVLIVAVVSSKGSYLNRWLGKPPLRWLGKVSYSMYMAHAAVLYFVTQLVRLNGGMESPGYFGLIALVLATLLILLVSELSYRWIESPFREFSRRVSPAVAEYRA